MDIKKINNKIYSKLIKDKARLWSFSKINTYEGCPHEDYLSKVIRLLDLKKPENVYTKSGTLSHDILEKHYMKEDFQDKESMLEQFNKGMLEILAEGFRFMSTKIEMNYLLNMRMYWQMFETDPDIVECEKFVAMPLGRIDRKYKDNYFQGWCDAILIRDGKISIGDFKSSTIFKGADLRSKSKQLILYAIAYEKCYKKPVESIFFDFMQYCNITYKNGKGVTKNVTVKRSEIYKYENIEKIEKGYVFVQLTPEVKEEALNWFLSTLNKRNSDKQFLNGEGKGIKDFYCKNLCGCKNYCKYMGNQEPELPKKD